jgi:hypothetical protein
MMQKWSVSDGKQSSTGKGSTNMCTAAPLLKYSIAPVSRHFKTVHQQQG